jgi:hypothetical protein
MKSGTRTFFEWGNFDRFWSILWNWPSSRFYRLRSHFVERFGLIYPGFHENRENEQGISSTEKTLASRIPSTILHPHHKYSFNLQHRAKKLGHSLVSAVSTLGHTWHVPYSEGPRASDYYYSYLCRLRASLRLVLETFRRLLELVPCNHLLEQHPLAPIPAY